MDASWFKVRSTIFLYIAVLVSYHGYEKQEHHVDSYFLFGITLVLWLSTILLLYGVISNSYKCVRIFMLVFLAHLVALMLLASLELHFKPESLSEFFKHTDIKDLRCILCSTLDVSTYLLLGTFCRRLYLELFTMEVPTGSTEKLTVSLM